MFFQENKSNEFQFSVGYPFVLTPNSHWQIMRQTIKKNQFE